MVEVFIKFSRTASVYFSDLLQLSHVVNYATVWLLLKPQLFCHKAAVWLRLI